MKVNGKFFRSIWTDENCSQVNIIDQSILPHKFEIIALKNIDQFCDAIVNMKVRGAPLIGATAAFGLAFALQDNASSTNEEAAAQKLINTRPTAINLSWAINRVRNEIKGATNENKSRTALMSAQKIADEDIQTCNDIGNNGLKIIDQIRSNNYSKTINILTHCNAGWLATVDWGTALAPIYKAFEKGFPIHVWVDETRPRNQGASLTAWELSQHGIPHTIIPDNTGGHLMQHGLVDLCIVGSDRTTATGDVCNKIGTYLKALAAADNNIPFYVALPTSTIDWNINDGINEIPIEERDPQEVTTISGINADGIFQSVTITPKGSRAANYGFDVTPAKFITGLITEKGNFPASIAGLKQIKSLL